MSTCECGRTWTGLSEAHCATCHESFSTVANFDAHRFFRSGKDGDWNSRSCRSAAEIDQMCSKSGRKLFQRAERKGGYVWVGAGAPYVPAAVTGGGGMRLEQIRRERASGP